MKNACMRIAALLLGGLLAGCSTIKPYDAEFAKESRLFGTVTKPDAVGVVKAKASVSGEIADYRSFLVDEEGFSYTKTTEKKETEWKGKKSKEVVSTEKLTRNVPWSAITEIAPYEEEYGPPFRHIRYRVRMEYSVTTVKYSSRVKERETMVLNCPTRQDLADVVAALKVLTGQ